MISITDILSVQPDGQNFAHDFLTFDTSVVFDYIVNEVYTNKLPNTVYALLLDYRSGEFTDGYEPDVFLLTVNDTEFYLDDYEVDALIEECERMGITPAEIKDPCGSNYGSGLLIGE